jgi:hypothetical protein
MPMSCDRPGYGTGILHGDSTDFTDRLADGEAPKDLPAGRARAQCTRRPLEALGRHPAPDARLRSGATPAACARKGNSPRRRRVVVPLPGPEHRSPRLPPTATTAPARPLVRILANPG